MENMMSRGLEVWAEAVVAAPVTVRAAIAATDRVREKTDMWCM